MQVRNFSLFLLLLAVSSASAAGFFNRAARAAPLTTPDELSSMARLKARIRDLRRALDELADPQPYVVIDRVHNRLEIRQGERILESAVCATGSGSVLLGPEKSWHFETPRGVFQVQRKVTDPVWAKPAWAFAEQGRRAPVLPWEFDRLDPTTLGKYAMELGDGYEIHGTLYPNLLGRSITHGCIRLNDRDLKTAYHLTRVGSRVYIY